MKNVMNIIKKLKEKGKEKILNFDIYSQPINLTYKQNINFITSYGIIFSILTIFITIIIMLDVFFSEDNLISRYTKIDHTYNSNLKIDLVNELFIFFSIYGEDNNKYENLLQTSYFFPTFQMQEKKISNLSLGYKETNHTIDECTKKVPKIDSSEFQLRFSNNKTIIIYCIQNNQLDLTGMDLYFSKFSILFDKNLKSKGMDNYFEDKVLELYFGIYSYEMNFNMAFVKKRLYFKDFLNNSNKYYAELKRNKYVFYNGFFNLKSENTFYELEDFYLDKTYSNKKYLFELELKIPITTTVIYVKSSSFLYNLGIIAGWLYLITSIMSILVSKCSRLKLYESIANDSFSLITSKNVEEIEKISKENSEKLQGERVNLFELILDDAYKYKQHDQLKLSFLEMISYLFCCDFCKSKETKMNEKTLRKGLNELFKTIDIINVVKTCQEIRLLKEIVFESHQKRLFEHLVHPIITHKEVICAYDLEYFETKAKSEAEKDNLMKGNLKDALIQLSMKDRYSDIELKLIDLFFVSPDLKKIFFKLDTKVDNVKSNFFNLKDINVNSDHVKKFEKYVKLIEHSIEQFKYINSSLIHETSEILKGYKHIFEENKILKDIVYGDLRLQLGDSIENIKDDILVMNYHPLILSKDKNEEQLELYRSIQKFKKNKGIGNFMQYIAGGFFLMIDYIFFAYKRSKYIERYYPSSVFHAFQGKLHCLRISFLTFLVFLYFFIVTISNNSKSSDCKVWGLCYGFLSFHKKPIDIIFTFTICLIFFLVLMFIYVLNLILKYILSNNESGYLKRKFAYSKMLFLSPNLKLYTEEDSNNFIETFIKNQKNYDKYINNTKLSTNILNICILLTNLLMVGLNSYMTLSVIQIFNTIEKLDYFPKLLCICILQSIIVNGFPLISLLLTSYHVSLNPKLFFIIKFWMPFISKAMAFSFILISNFQIFMGNETSFFHNIYSLKYDNQQFICREDQAAYNLIYFMISEFLLRKIASILFTLLMTKMRFAYNPGYSIVGTMCQFYVLNITTLIFPIIGLVTVIIFCIDYHLEYLVLIKLKKKPVLDENDSKYELFNILGLFSNLLALIIVNVIFQNQFSIMENKVLDENLINYPPMCLHQNLSDDYQNKFRKYFDTSTLAIFDSVQIFILVPTFFGIIIVMIYSKDLLTKFSSDIKVLLTSYEDKKPKQICDEFIKNKNETQNLINNYEVSKNIIEVKDKDIKLDQYSIFSKDLE